MRIQTEVEVQENRMKLANNLIAIEWVWIFKNRGLTTALATYVVHNVNLLSWEHGFCETNFYMCSVFSWFAFLKRSFSRASQPSQSVATPVQQHLVGELVSISFQPAQLVKTRSLHSR